MAIPNEMLAALIEQQAKAIKLLNEQLQSTKTNTINIPWPAPLDIERGDISQNFENFVLSWKDYMVASDMDKWPSSDEDKKIKTFSWKDYMVASDMDKWPSSDEDKKIKTFFTALGSSALTKYNRFQLTAEEQRNMKIDTVIEAIRKKLSSKKNVIYDRAMFNSCNQENDSFDEYLLKLQKLIAKCEFRDFETDLLRDRIVLGIINKDLRKRLMATSDLTLERAQIYCEIESY
ncbi:hypothetical protein QE152_g38846 [Popillia japonica]|uniref:Retrotransposon gag domain-containing protein n=1 Tax=Popillia japonica TaxID=7064 RepID=A0AAW1HVS2_POPJA